MKKRRKGKNIIILGKINVFNSFVHSRPITPTPSLNEEDLNFERELTGGDFSELFSDVVYQSPRTIVYERVLFVFITFQLLQR